MTELTDEAATGNGAGGADASMTIDELARRSGMTVRNIRAHQSRGLVPPPKVRGRTGYYGDEHLARIELIKELQGDGFNLEAIRRLLERRLANASVSGVEIERGINHVTVAIHTAKPGIVIGRGGQNVEILRKEIGDSEQVVSLTGLYHNLLRRWADA